MSLTESRREYVAQEAFWETPEGQAQAERGMAEDFIRLAMLADANALAFFAPSVRDGGSRLRVQTMAEVMKEALEYESDHSLTEAMQALLNIAYGSVPLETQRAQVRDLLDRMAAQFARFNSDPA